MSQQSDTQSQRNSSDQKRSFDQRLDQGLLDQNLLDQRNKFDLRNSAEVLRNEVPTIAKLRDTQSVRSERLPSRKNDIFTNTYDDDYDQENFVDASFDVNDEANFDANYRGNYNQDSHSVPNLSHAQLSRQNSFGSLAYSEMMRYSRDSTSILKNRASQTLYTAKIDINDVELVFSQKSIPPKRIENGVKIEKPWLKDTNRSKIKLINYIMFGGFLAGLAVMAIFVFFGWKSVTNEHYCEVLNDNFETFNEDIWQREVQVGGFGTGAFDWTTDSERNSFVRDNKLYILPTLTNETISNDLILNGHTVNLTKDGTCTSSGKGVCWITSNSSTGVIIPPVQSARLNTKISSSIRYGKVEVVAKMPKGDWLWPAIWLLPTNNTYGVWPASGEIDIAESRGNSYSYEEGGYDTISSTLHWGPITSVDGYLKTTQKYTRKLGMFPNTFHKFGLEWNEKYIKTYVDNRLRQVFYHGFRSPFWKYGQFSTTYDNGSVIVDPWPEYNNIAPFDQEFYLILNVAVGGTNGFFPDKMGSKPWKNSQGDVAPKSFWESVSSWYPTWPKKDEDRALVVKSVKMYKTCAKESRSSSSSRRK